MTILPDDGQRIGADCDHVGQAGGRVIFHLAGEHCLVRLRLHILVPAAAGGTRTGGYGIANMQARAAELGGSLHLRHSSSGTVVETDIPL